MMSLFTRRTYLLVAVYLILGTMWVVGCGPMIATTGVFTQVSRIESDLTRGVSTKSDVQQVLGVPAGSGNAIFPTDATSREVWFYQDIELTDTKAEGKQIIRVNMRQQILLVFFREEIFDGFMWYSSIVPGTGTNQ